MNNKYTDQTCASCTINNVDKSTNAILTKLHGIFDKETYLNELNVSSFNGQENENANTKYAEFTKAVR